MNASELTGNSIVGSVQTLPLTMVKPNGWNPNRMAPHVYESIRNAMKTEGWLASQALLIWHTDDKGQERNLIIDGEHRWTVAKEVGYSSGPMVLLKGIAESKAKALTVAMNNRRGAFDDTLLSDLVKSLDGALDNISLELAIPDADILKMFSFEPEVASLGVDPKKPAKPQTNIIGPDGSPVVTDGTTPAPALSSVKMVNLFLDTSNYDEFHKIVSDLGKKYGTKNITDTVFQAVRNEVAGK